MGYLTALIACVARLFRPSQGVHTSPFGYLRELAFEMRRRRSSRVRRYAVVLPVAQDSDPREVPVGIPVPRRPLDDLPRAGVQPSPRTTDAGLPRTAMSAVRSAMEPHVQPQAAMVRPVYRRWECERARAEHRARVDRDRLGLAVL